MSKFKINRVGVDLRDLEKTLVVPDITPNGSVVMLDILAPKEFLFKGGYEKILKESNSELVVFADLEKFSPENEWEGFSRLYEEWIKTIITSIANTPLVTIIFKNFPGGTKTPKEEKWWNFDNGNIGLEISDIKNWKKEMEDWKNLFGEYPKVVARSISPLLYDIDLEKFLELHQPYTIGLDWDGGKYSKEVEYKAFGKSFLLSFAGYHSHMILLPIYSGDWTEVFSPLEFLNGLKGKEIETEEEKEKYLIKKNVDRIVKTPTRLIYNSVKFNIKEDDEVTIPFNDPEVLYPYSDINFSFTKLLKSTPVKSGTSSEINTEFKKELVKKVKAYKKLSYNEYWKWSYLIATNLIENKYFKEEDLWTTEYYNIGEFAIGIICTQIKKKNWFTKHFPDEVINVRNFFLIRTDDVSAFVDIDGDPETDGKKD